MARFVLNADGAARGNPGPAGAGAVLLDPEGRAIATLRRALGIATNNRAEYEALVMGLEEAKRRGVRELVVRLDSELLVRQLRGEYRVKHPALRPLAQRALRLLSEFAEARVEHVPRERNVHADRLANEAIDAAIAGESGEAAFVSLVSRAIARPVDEVERERVSSTPLAEVDRVRWRAADADGTLVFKRMRRPASVEAGLLPYLARRGIPVPEVVASGIPPAHVREPRPWLLLAEVGGVPLREAATAELARAAAGVLVELRRATAGDATLVALGIPRLPPTRIRDEALDVGTLLDAELGARVRELAAGADIEVLEARGASLVHGEYGGENVRVVDGRLVVLEWARAHVGSPLADLARLARDLRARDPALVEEALAALSESADVLRAADALQDLASIRWERHLSEQGLVGADELRRRVRVLLGEGRAPWRSERR